MRRSIDLHPMRGCNVTIGRFTFSFKVEVYVLANFNFYLLTINIAGIST